MIKYFRDSIVYDILGSTKRIKMDNIISWRKYIVEFAKKHPNEVCINGQPKEKVVAITFDDGPDSKITPGILDILKNNNIKANFFFLGSQVNYFPSVVKRAYNEGHLILNHGYNHPYFTKITPEDIRKQVLLTEKKIEDIIGKRPSFIRPPYGDTDEKVLSVLRGMNDRIIIWSIDSMDWVINIDKQDVVNNVLNNARLGDIILMHSGPGQNMALKALPEIIYGLKNREFGIKDIGTMLNVNPYK